MSKKKKKNPLKRAIKKVFDLGLFLLAVLVLTYILSNYVVERMVIENHSMEETLSPDDGVLIDKISLRFTDIKRFDIIVFKENGTGKELIKRVYGLPHETVRIENGKIYIDGEEIEDIEGLDAPDFAGNASNTIKLKEGEYFVLGDNRSVSIDSRYDEVGLVTSTRIVGKLFMRLTPLNKIKFF